MLSASGCGQINYTMEPDTAKLATYKRIIVCADGTWLASNLGDSSKPSNVARIARALAQTGIDENGFKVEQIVYYQSGLGSGDLPLQKAIYGESHSETYYTDSEDI